jgi:hypothetical protein
MITNQIIDKICLFQELDLENGDFFQCDNFLNDDHNQNANIKKQKNRNDMCNNSTIILNEVENVNEKDN